MLEERHGSGRISGGWGGPQALGHQPSLLHVSPGAVKNASSLFTYDSRLLVNKFLYGPKHDPTFQPLFPEETTPSPSLETEAAKLCGDNHFCSFDVAATGSLSVGNATRVAHQLHQHRMQNLQPGEACRWHRQGGRYLTLGHSPPKPAAEGGGQWLKVVICAPSLPQWCPVAG